jgi:hypothetical protein
MLVRKASVSNFSLAERLRTYAAYPVGFEKGAVRRRNHGVSAGGLHRRFLVMCPHTPAARSSPSLGATSPGGRL